MASAIMEFVRLGLRQVDAGELIAALSDADLGDTSVADVQEALGLLREEVDEPGQPAITMRQANLDASMTTVLAGTDLPATALTEPDVARYTLDAASETA